MSLETCTLYGGNLQLRIHAVWGKFTIENSNHLVYHTSCVCGESDKQVRILIKSSGIYSIVNIEFLWIIMWRYLTNSEIESFSRFVFV